ncbi:hypothetical protein GCM10008938_48530 [Deinococcus roseus]|uniref:Uncharacterized protein n=2 Tax=Deinococcus roseus TaxID=392414 RepID=A0ABQ2DG75_9DEIO|nr:hypothetical protein GCM10008938_48530 [Deinococcus roseus]
MYRHTFNIFLLRKDDTEENIGSVPLDHELQQVDLSIQAMQTAAASMLATPLTGMIQFQACIFPTADVRGFRAVCLKIEEVPET